MHTPPGPRATPGALLPVCHEPQPGQTTGTVPGRAAGRHAGSQFASSGSLRVKAEDCWKILSADVLASLLQTATASRGICHSAEPPSLSLGPATARRPCTPPGRCPGTATPCGTTELHHGHRYSQGNSSQLAELQEHGTSRWDHKATSEIPKRQARWHRRPDSGSVPMPLGTRHSGLRHRAQGFSQAMLGLFCLFFFK